MFGIKRNAQNTVERCGAIGAVFALLSFLTAAASAVCLVLWGCCVFKGTRAVFSFLLPREVWDRFPGVQTVLPGACLLLCALFLWANLTYTYAYKAVFYGSAAGDRPNVRRLLSPANGLRYGAYLLRRTTVRAVLALRCFLPLFVTLLLLSALIFSVGLPKALLPPAVFLLCLQFFSCFGVFLIFAEQFRLALFLLVLHPQLPVKDAFFSSALLTEGKLLRLFVFRLRMLPWRIFSCCLLPLFFTIRYLPAMEGAVCEWAYGEKRLPMQRRQSPVRPPEPAPLNDASGGTRQFVTGERKSAYQSAGGSGPTAPRRIIRASAEVSRPSPSASPGSTMGGR